MRSVYAIAKADLLSSWRGFYKQTIQNNKKVQTIQKVHKHTTNTTI